MKVRAAIYRLEGMYAEELDMPSCDDGRAEMLKGAMIERARKGELVFGPPDGRFMCLVQREVLIPLKVSVQPSLEGAPEPLIRFP